MQRAEEKYARIALLGTQWGQHKQALEAALVVKRASDPAQAAQWALAALAHGHLETPRSLEGAQHFASLLLDGESAVRRATLAAIAAWPRRSPFSDVVTYLVPQLDQAEAAQRGR